MENCLEKGRKTGSLIVVLCLIPLFFYVRLFCFTGYGLLVFPLVHIPAGTTAVFLLLFRRLQTAQLLHRCFWGLMSFSTLGVILFAVLGRYGLFFWLLSGACFLIQLLFPAIHLVLETRKQKRLFMQILLCIYSFSLVIGCTILFLGKDSPVEFFPITAISGILLELLQGKTPEKS